jgi:hypothetical protein
MKHKPWIVSYLVSHQSINREVQRMSCSHRWSHIRRKIRLALPVFLIFVYSNTSSAQLILEPGETYSNVPAAGKVLKNTGEQRPPPPNVASTGLDASVSTVSFDRNDSLTQNIRLHTEVNPRLLSKSAVARGILYVDFCVPQSGLDHCNLPPDSDAPDITASIRFGYGVVGVVSALGPGSKATFSASAAVIDLQRSEFVNYQSLSDMSASLGTVKVVLKVPIPIPDLEGSETTQPVTFTTLLKRGVTYRFQLSGASTAQGFATSRVSSDYYSFANPSLVERGRLQLHNLTIQVGQEPGDTSKELNDLKALVSSLVVQLGHLGAQVESLRENYEEDTTALRQEFVDLAENIEVQGSIVFLPTGSDAPAGYTFLGDFDLPSSGGPRGRKHMTSIAVFIKEEPNQLD